MIQGKIGVFFHMKFIITKTELLAIIGKVQNIVPTKPSNPVLANILIQAIDDQVIVSATYATISMQAYADAKVEEEGSITLPARRFFQLARELTAPQIEVHTLSPEVAQINSGSSHFKIHGMQKEEFPTFPDLSDQMTTDLPVATLKELLGKTAFAAGREDSRQTLNGVCLQNLDTSAIFIATDGKKLAKAYATLSLASGKQGSFILPIKAVEEILRLLDGKEETAKLILMQDKCGLQVGKATLITNLILGQYPDVSRVIPEISQHPLKLHREELISLLKQVALFTSETAGSVRFTFSTGQLQLSAGSGDIGEGTVQMPVNYQGEKVEIAFQPTHFLDILRHSKDETINFELSDSYNPGLITDSSSALFVLMPMKLT